MSMLLEVVLLHSWLITKPILGVMIRVMPSRRIVSMLLNLLALRAMAFTSRLFLAMSHIIITKTCHRILLVRIMTKLIESWPKHSHSWHHTKLVRVKLMRILRRETKTWIKTICHLREIASMRHHLVSSAMFQTAMTL